MNTHKKLKDKTHKKYNYTCVYCLKDLSDNYRKYREGKITRKNMKLTVDHIIPLSKGGKWELDNLVSCCRDCNIKKGNTILDE